MKTQHLNIDSGLLPIDSWEVMCLLLLDVVNNVKRAPEQLFKLSTKPDRVVATLTALSGWRKGNDVLVRNDMQLFQMLKFVAWRLGIEKKFVREGTLRNIVSLEDPSFADLGIMDLLEVDHSGVFASAATICGDRISRSDMPLLMPPYLERTAHAVYLWHQAEKYRQPWGIPIDLSAVRQLKAMVSLIRGEGVVFEPECPRDFFFGKIFGRVTLDDALERWPDFALSFKERIKLFDAQVAKYSNQKIIESPYGPEMRAMVMHSKTRRSRCLVDNRCVATHDWPDFWEAVDQVILNNAVVV